MFGQCIMIYSFFGKKIKNNMKIKLISKKNLNKLIKADPNQRNYSTEKYYKFIIKYLYLQRIKLGIKLLGKQKYNKMLDVGFGGGVILPELSKHAEKIIGIDTHDNIELVKKILISENINNTSLIKINATSLPFPDKKFDCIWCMSVLEFIKNSEQVIREIKRVAQNNATIIIGFPLTNKLTDILYKLISFKSSEAHYNNHKILISQIKKYFKIKKIKKIPGIFLVCKVVK